MSPKVNRREFVKAGAVAGVAAAATPGEAFQAPAVSTKKPSRPVVVASGNGQQSKNGGDKTCVETAFERIMKGDDVLDALIAGVNIVELDPADTSVGYGGLPNAEGVVQLDASVMHGPTKRAGAVASIEGVRTPSLVAQRVMEETDHHLIVGQDAQRFARSMGFKIEDDLNTERSRRGLDRMEAADGSAALPVTDQEAGGASASRTGHDRRRLGRSQSLLRHDQLQWRQRAR